MASGGARNRSGPGADPKSARSDARGFILTALPSEGYRGGAPAFPLQPAGGEDADLLASRELDVWAEAWTTPQAAAWSTQAWRWPIIAEYCRIKTAIEFDPTASASLIAQLHRYRDQIGLTPAGLKENGWAVATDELADRANSSATDKPASRGSSRDRMSVVNGGR